MVEALHLVGRSHQAHERGRLSKTPCLRAKCPRHRPCAQTISAGIPSRRLEPIVRRYKISALFLLSGPHPMGAALVTRSLEAVCIVAVMPIPRKGKPVPGLGNPRAARARLRPATSCAGRADVYNTSVVSSSGALVGRGPTTPPGVFLQTARCAGDYIGVLPTPKVSRVVIVYGSLFWAAETTRCWRSWFLLPVTYSDRGEDSYR